MALYFQNESHAKKIFRDIKAGTIGENDIFEQLRVSIIEGEIPGEESGYSVFVGTDYDGLKARVESEGGTLQKSLTLMINRIHRMNPPPGSPNLQRFKESYNRFGEYSLMPAVMRNQQVALLLELAIKKKKLNWMTVESLTENNEEFVILSHKGK